MTSIVTVLQWLIRFLALLQLTLGVLFWTGNAFTLIPAHMLSGLLLVLSIWVQAGLALRTGVHFGLPALAFAWGVLVIALGVNQDSLLTGDLHWLIKVLHVLVGAAAVGQAEGIARRTLSRQAERRTTSDTAWSASEPRVRGAHR